MISGSTGLLSSVVVDGTHILLDGSCLDEADSMHLQFHADVQPSDGYDDALRAIGLDKELCYVTKGDSQNVALPLSGDDVSETQLDTILVKRVSGGDANGEWCSDGVSCEWDMGPTDVDR